ncbi:MAG TPA: biotin-dependent carboxyltransferase family protein [Chthoniobacterales bacterium]
MKGFLPAVPSTCTPPGLRISSSVTPKKALFSKSLSAPCRLHFADERVIACCGADSGISLGKPRRVQPNEELELHASQEGCRCWLAIAGGIEVAQILGSRATDLRGHFGGFEGRALRDGDELPLGEPSSSLQFSGRTAGWLAPNEWAETASSYPVLGVVPGSEWDNFTAAAQADFLGEHFIVRREADRMGARLAGAKLARTREKELLSEAVTPGTIQVAGDGQPILLLGDCQTIGGYPKIAHVITVDLPRAAQLRPNDEVRFEMRSHEEARALFAARERDLERFRLGLKLRSA